MSTLVDALLKRGVVIPAPTMVHIGADVVPERIHSGAILHPGCRIDGAGTSIGPACELGAEGQVTVRDCQLGAGVKLRGGFFHNATLLDEVDCGDASHIRPGCLLEECVTIGHANGLKQTILMPYTTLGSLINFCDVLMSGGTGCDNHGEVGSSYIHFNFTPHQDKATPSLAGDVPRGVLLDQPPIFLGGQGGMVGPCRVAFGTVVAAGTILRQDIIEENTLFVSSAANHRPSQRPFEPGLYGMVGRVISNNLNFIGNLLALQAWYRHARRSFLMRTPWGKACYAGALARLDEALAERIVRLEQLACKLNQSVVLAKKRGRDPASTAFATQRRFSNAWPELRCNIVAKISEEAAPSPHAATAINRLANHGVDFVTAVQALPAADKPAITQWLREVVEDANALFSL